MVLAVLVENRVELTFGTIIFVLRWLCRWKSVGIAKWFADDWFSIVAWVFYVVLAAMVEYLAVVGAAAGMTQEMREQLSPELRESFVKGGKAMFASFYFFTGLVWSLKGSLLGFYWRLTRGIRLHKFIQIVSLFAIISFLAAIFTETFHCMPIHKNWQVLPDPGTECSSGVVINIVIASGNVITDAMLISVPFFLLKDAKITLWRKIKIGFLLSLGCFVIAMSLVRCILTVQDPTTVNQSSVWAMRESIVAIFAVNAPILNALFQRSTWTTGFSSGTASRMTKGSVVLDSGADYHTSSTTSGHTRGQAKRIEIYRMTDIETSSKESTRELVDDKPQTGWRASVSATPHKH